MVVVVDDDEEADDARVSFLSVKSCVGGASTVCLRTIRLKASCLQSRVDYMDGSNQCDQIWRNCTYLVELLKSLTIFRVDFVLGKILNPLAKLALGQILVIVGKWPNIEQ